MKDEHIISRRKFIKYSAGIAAGASLTGLLLNYFTEEVELQPGKKALLVMQHEKRSDDVKLLRQLLRKRGYACSIMKPSETTEKGIFRTIEQIARDSDDNSQTIFHYSGHGHEISRFYTKGITVNGNPLDLDESRIIPFELFEVLGKIKGKKAVTIDSCHSGVFVNYIKDHLEFHERTFGNMIDNYVVIAACPEEYRSIASPDFMRGKFLGQLTFGLYNLLQSSKGPIDLSTAEILCANEAYRKNPKKVAEEIGKPNDPLSFEMQRISDTKFWL